MGQEVSRARGTKEQWAWSVVVKHEDIKSVNSAPMITGCNGIWDDVLYIREVKWLVNKVVMREIPGLSDRCVT